VKVIVRRPSFSATRLLRTEVRPQSPSKFSSLSSGRTPACDEPVDSTERTVAVGLEGSVCEWRLRAESVRARI